MSSPPLHREARERRAVEGAGEIGVISSVKAPFFHGCTRARGGDDDLVFAGDCGTFLDGSALRRRYKAALTRAGLRPLRFHDLRHTFGTRMIAKADIRRVQEWMGHDRR
jgi:integrase